MRILRTPLKLLGEFLTEKPRRSLWDGGFERRFAATGDRRYLSARRASSLAFALAMIVRDVFRARGVVAELHGELATAGGHGA
jgi:hypothetical protein